MSFINNTIIQLFDLIEKKTGVPFASFTTSESEQENNITTASQKYMTQYTGTSTQIYKYLYDPDLSFDFRFHQRLASINYTDRSKPWITILFNTGQVKSLTGVLSHTYKGYARKDKEVYGYTTRRVVVPINLVLISNDLTYLYGATEKLAMYFDRIINFHYTEHVNYSETFEEDYELTGMVRNIHQVDLVKLSTQDRSSLTTTAFTFDLVYWVTEIPKAVGILEKVILDVKVRNHDVPLTVTITE